MAKFSRPCNDNVFFFHNDATSIFLPIGTIVSAQPSGPMGFPLFFLLPILRTDGFERSLKNAYFTTHSNSRLSAQRCDSNDASPKLITKTQIQRWYFSLVGWDNLFWSGDEVGQELLVSPILLLSTHLPSAQPPSPPSPPSPPTHLKNSFHPLGSHFSLYPSFPLGSPAHHSLCYC